MKPLAKDPVLDDENSIIDGIVSDIEICRAKLWVNSQAKLVKSKNKIKLDFLAKFKLLADSSSGTDFLIPAARLAFAKLR